jgi:hypothetical protein
MDFPLLLQQPLTWDEDLAYTLAGLALRALELRARVAGPSSGPELRARAPGSGGVTAGSSCGVPVLRK